MAKIKKKFINNLMKINDTDNTTTLVLTDPTNGDRVEVKVKTKMTIAEKGIFIDRVVNSCFDESGDYLPQYRDPVFNITLLQMTTDIPVFEYTEPILNEDGSESGQTVSLVDIEKTYDLCRIVDLSIKVEDTDFIKLVFDLSQLVDSKIEYRAKQLSNMH